MRVGAIFVHTRVHVENTEFRLQLMEDRRENLPIFKVFVQHGHLRPFAEFHTESRHVASRQGIR